MKMILENVKKDLNEVLIAEGLRLDKIKEFRNKVDTLIELMESPTLFDLQEIGVTDSLNIKEELLKNGIDIEGMDVSDVGDNIETLKGYRDVIKRYVAESTISLNQLKDEIEKIDHDLDVGKRKVFEFLNEMEEVESVDVKLT